MSIVFHVKIYEKKMGGFDDSLTQIYLIESERWKIFVYIFWWITTCGRKIHFLWDWKWKSFNEFSPAFFFRGHTNFIFFSSSTRHNTCDDDDERKMVWKFLSKCKLKLLKLCQNNFSMKTLIYKYKYTQISSEFSHFQ